MFSLGDNCHAPIDTWRTVLMRNADASFDSLWSHDASTVESMSFTMCISTAIIFSWHINIGWLECIGIEWTRSNASIFSFNIRCAFFRAFDWLICCCFVYAFCFHAVANQARQNALSANEHWVQCFDCTFFHAGAIWSF